MGSAATGLFLKIGLGFLIVIILAALFFGVKYGMKWRKRKKNFKIDVVIYNPDGTWYTDKIGKFRGDDNMDKMVFESSGETMPVIDLKHIVALKATLWRYAPGQYAVVPPRIWGRKPKDFGLEIIDYQMKNFAYLEQRAAVSRWAYIKDLMQKWAPWITAVLILVLAGTAIYFIAQMASGMFAESARIRFQECIQVVGELAMNPVANAPVA